MYHRPAFAVCFCSNSGAVFLVLVSKQFYRAVGGLLSLVQVGTAHGEFPFIIELHDQTRSTCISFYYMPMLDYVILSVININSSIKKTLSIFKGTKLELLIAVWSWDRVVRRETNPPRGAFT